MALQVWLPLNGNLNNQGLYNTNITYTNFTSIDSGKIGKCIKCGTASTLVVCPSSVWDFTTKSVSFGGWVKINQAELAKVTSTSTYSGNYTTAGGTLFGNQNYGGLDLRWRTNSLTSNTTPTNVYLYGFIRDTNNSSVSSSRYSIPFDTWTHIFLVLNREDAIMSVYVNGSLFSESSLDLTKYTTGNVKQGDFKINLISWESGNGYGKIAPWYLNDVRIYDHALSPKEVKEISKGLILHYKLDGNDIGITIPRNGGLIPDGIELYDYILSSGTLWIDTGLLLSTFKILHDALVLSRAGNLFSLISCYSSSNKFFNLYTNDSSTIRFYSGDSTPVSDDWNRHTYIIDRPNTTDFTVSVDDTLKISSTSTLTSSAVTIKISRRGDGNAAYSNGSGRFFGTKIWTNNQLVRNLIPCTYLGEPGMWDTVENKFYRNQGTGLFTLGNKITLKEYESLTGDDNSYIDTGIIPTALTEIEATFSYGSSGRTDRYIFANWDSANATFCINVLTNTLRIFKYSTDNVYQTTLTANTKHTVKVTKNAVIVNGTSTNFTGETLPSFTKSLLLFGDSPTWLNSATIYEAKRWENGILMNHFIPVTYNSTPGMWDKVEWKFYANAGSGSFTLGPEKIVQQDAPIFYDSSGYCNHGSITGTLTTNSDSPRYTASTVFNGSNSVIKGTLQLSNDYKYTASFWLKPTSINTNTQWVFAVADNANHQFGCYVNSNSINTQVGGVVSSGNSKWITSIAANTLYHIVIVSDGTNVKVYKNGELLDTKAKNGTTTGTTFWIGQRPGASGMYNLNGKLSDFRIYATALSADDIKELYNTSAFICNNGTLCAYEFNESDSSVNVNKNGIVEAPTLYEVNTLTPSDVTITGTGVVLSKPPNNGTNIYNTGYKIEFNDISETKTYVLELDFNWSGNWAKGTGGTLDLFFQGSTKKVGEASYGWTGGGKNYLTNTLNSIARPGTLIKASPTGGSYHYKAVFTIPSNNVSDGFNLGVRCDYSDGNGSYGYGNLKLYPYDVSLDTEKAKIGSNYITCNEIIEI